MAVYIGDTPQQLEQGLLIDGELWTKERIYGLQSQVEQLRKAIIDATNTGAVTDTGKWVYNIDDSVLDKTPAQCLAEIKAQAGRDGFLAGLFSEIHQPTTVWNREERADEYANQLRQQAKAGE